MSSDDLLAGLRSRALLLPLLLCGCAHTEVTLLVGPRVAEGEPDLGAVLMISQPFGKRGVCSYLHSSNPTRGEPFDDRPELNLDGAMCGLRWGGK